MTKIFAFILAVFMVTLALWGLFFEHNTTTILINGQEINGPLKGMVGVGGMVIASIALIGLAIIMALAFAGTGIIIFGCMIVGGMILMVLMFPFLLPLLIPLMLIWGFIAIARHKS